MDIFYKPLTFNNNWVILTFLFLLLLLLFLKRAYTLTFNSQLNVLTQKVWIPNTKKTFGLIYNLFNIVFLIILSFSISFVFLLYKTHFMLLIKPGSFNLFLKYSLIFGSFFVFKHTLYFLFSLFFNIKSLIIKVLYFKMIYTNFLSLFVLVWLPFVLFNNIGINIIYNISVIISLLLALYFYYLIIKNNLKLISKHFFYFILYLCTLEIAPVILLYKVFF